MIRFWRKAEEPDVSLMDAVKLCHLCAMGQQDTNIDWFPMLLVRFASKVIF
jgi:hypothetical protein